MPRRQIVQELPESALSDCPAFQSISHTSIYDKTSVGVASTMSPIFASACGAHGHLSNVTLPCMCLSSTSPPTHRAGRCHMTLISPWFQQTRKAAIASVSPPTVSHVALFDYADAVILYYLVLTLIIKHKSNLTK
jgi:hypothetical protein